MEKDVVERPVDCGDKLETHDEVKVEIHGVVEVNEEGALEVEEVGTVEVEEVGAVEVEEVGAMEVEEVGALEVNELGTMEVEEVNVVDVKQEVQVDSLEEVENSEEEDEVDPLEKVENNEEEVQVDSLEDSDEDYRVEDSGRGLSDDDLESEKLLTLEDNGSEEDDSADKPSRCPFPTFGKKKSMTDYKSEVGTIFNDKEDFKEAIRSYAIHTGRDLKFVKNDKCRVRVRCMGGQKKCPWVAYCGYLPTRKIWQLRKIVDTHACSRQLNIKMTNNKWLSHEIDKSLHDNPSIKVQVIRNKTLRKWNTNVSISKARRAKLMATNEREGDFKEQFRRIHDYGHEVLRSNPGSTVKIKVNSDNGEAIFERIYVCLKACKDNFMSYRPIICLDGCFLKGLYKGELLTAVGRDPNDQMLPLAYTVVEVENKDSWSWFLQLLVEDLGSNEIRGACTWMSDQQKGLVQAIEELLPKKEKRFCIRHLYANFRKWFTGFGQDLDSQLK
ncbi:uncharacterized protein LOC106776700 [Vigna radiata var. radiata]|uniref:Uncharacterized protein LOC106776700 n=1 Tax=Vigna radiata var. radiata TaxID=3916 RepID=A0A1S3VNK3_VIGRR|nr:uncharacterized protein LOC106776700 [Vigna radiata var. radiata]